MNVYVESNFVLEIALHQEQVQSAEKILTLAKQGECQIFIPAFSLAEPFWTITQRGKERIESLNILIREQRNFSRSVKHKELAKLAGRIIEEIENIAFEEEGDLEDLVWDLIGQVNVLELGIPVLTGARDILLQLDLGMQDAIVLASILEHLENLQNRSESVFISRDRRDFGNPLIIQRLKNLDCTYISNFKDGLGFIQSSI
ncbi:MAG: hypothetical protein IIC13_07930 [SAR324 cluster bacterium]|nr:hypothetical protein [SAR324 cluster bacterium]